MAATAFFWLAVILYWVVAIKRLPVYYKRVDEHNAEAFPYLHKDTGMAKNNAWESFALAAFWPFYEAGRWVQNTIILTATAEERKQAEYEKAAKIVEDYQKQKEREAKEAFEKAMKEEW